jgi:flagellar M-ring protein FliF
VFDNIQQRWSASGNGTRAAFFGGLLAIALLFVWLIVWSVRDNFQVLFSDLDPQDASTIVGELEKIKVPYRLEDGGKSILVDKDAVYKTRLKLMGKGVNLRGTVGFEIFNNTDFGTTEFAQKINYQRALQGELARTIMDFDEVKFARVHLVMPESGLFKKNNVKPKASISLIMKGDSQLSAEQVTGIQRLVSASVPEIDAASVTVLDQRGVALTRNREAEGEAEASNGRLESKKQIEAYITRKVADMLDKAVGAGQAIVSVDVTLTQDHVKTTREDVIPLSMRDGESAGSVVRRRQTQNAPVAREADSVALKLSTDTSAAEPAPAPKRESPRMSGTTETEYQNGRKVEQTVSTPGSIRRISVGILLPDNIPLERADKIRDVVSMAAGLNVARGDSIAIYSIEQFAARNAAVAKGVTAPAAGTPKDPVAMHADDRHSGIVKILWMVLAGAVLLAMAVLLVRSFRRIDETDGHVMHLSEAERMETLASVRQWISGGTESSSVEAKT